MAPLSAKSQLLLQSVHPTLAAILAEVTLDFDLVVLTGARTDAEQAVAYAKGLSKTLNSKHKVQADGFSHAADVASTPQLWEAQQETRLTRYDVQQIAMLFYIKGFAKARGVKVRIGVDWDGDNHWDGLQKDNPFLDDDHVEIVLEDDA